jgi:hypothetical protein
MTKYSVTFFDGEKNDTQFKNSKHKFKHIPAG